MASGQSTVEYTLILFACVMVGLMALWRFGAAFESWGHNYFGSYVECLIATGTLPQSGHNASASGSLCEDYHAPFSFSQGRPPKARASNRARSSNTSSTRTRSNRTNSRQAKSARSSDSNRRNASADGRRSESRERVPIGAYAGQGESYQGPSNRGKAASSTGPAGASGRASSAGRVQIEQDQRQTRARAGRVQGFDSSGTGRKGTLIPVAKPPPARMPAQIPALSFMGLIRLLIMIAMLLALLLVLGAQALRLKKSLES